MSNWLKCILKGGKCSVELKGRGARWNSTKMMKLVPFSGWVDVFVICNFLPMVKRKWNASGQGDRVCFWGVYSLFIQTILLDYRLYCMYMKTQSVHVSVITLVHRLLSYHLDKSIWLFWTTTHVYILNRVSLVTRANFQRSSIQGSFPVNLSICPNLSEVETFSWVCQSDWV